MKNKTVWICESPLNRNGYSLHRDPDTDIDYVDDFRSSVISGNFPLSTDQVFSFKLSSCRTDYTISRGIIFVIVINFLMLAYLQ